MTGGVNQSVNAIILESINIGGLVFRVIILFSILMGFSVSVFADTYPAFEQYFSSAFPASMYPSGESACTGAAHVYDATYTGEYTPPVGTFGNCKVYSSSSQLITSNTVSINRTCPFGGSQTTSTGPCETYPLVLLARQGIQPANVSRYRLTVALLNMIMRVFVHRYRIVMPINRMVGISSI